MSTWIWSDDHGLGRNRFMLLRRAVTMSEPPTVARLNCFVDNRYRLRINGQVIGHGPARFVPAHPLYDTYDLAPYLTPGRHVLTIECWSPGSSTYQSMPESRGAALIWGEIKSGTTLIDLADMAQWQCRAAEAWDGDAASFSFAQGPVEECDTRQLPEAWFTDSTLSVDWAAPIPLKDTSVWNTPVLRTLPMLSEAVQLPTRLELAATVVNDEQRFIVRVRGAKGQWVPYAACLCSPCEQNVELGLFWGDTYLNGHKIKAVNHALLGNRQVATVTLRQGWNCLYGEANILSEAWGVSLAVANASAVTIHATTIAPAGTMAVGQVYDRDGLTQARGATIPKSVTDVAALSVGFAAYTTQSPTIVARQCAWDQPQNVLHANSPVTYPFTCPASQSSVWVFDFGGEILGRMEISIDAPAGTIVDIALDERKRADGLLALYVASPFTDGADRFICRGGKQTLSAFHPRGGRWLQVHVRPPTDAKQAVIIHHIGNRSAQVPIADTGNFTCADRVFDWTYTAGAQTLRACVEDAFLDCPWRERGTYLGDALIEAGALRSMDANPAVTVRCIDLWAEGQMPTGQMQACVPSWHRRPHEDFSLIWILLVHDHWYFTGDLAPAARHWSVLQNILASADYKSSTASLWSGRGTHAFIDWGAPKDRADLDDHGCLNAYRYRALRCAAELARALGSGGQADEFMADAATVRTAFSATLWNQSQGRFHAGTRESKVCDVGERHANVLALAFGLVDGDNAERLASYVVDQLRDNFTLGCQGGHSGGHIELYFFGYALPGLWMHGYAAAAEALIRTHYGAMQQAGAWTLWECFSRGVVGAGSLCHAWSCAPMIAFHRFVLGVQPIAGGNTQTVVICPDSALPWASGTVPHPRGPITVAWKRDGGILTLRVRGPANVDFIVKPGPSFTDCRLVMI